MNEKTSELKKTVGSLSEQKKNLNIALYYTHGDQEIAKNMLAGRYKDLYVIKGRFSASTTFGLFLLFFNIPYGSLANLSVIMSHSYSIEKIKTNTDWRDFEKDIDNINKAGDYDNEFIIKMKDVIRLSSFCSPIISEKSVFSSNFLYKFSSSSVSSLYLSLTSNS